MTLRNPDEVFGKLPTRDELPGALKRPGTEPPAGEQRVVFLLRRIEEEVGVGVRHLENVGGGDRRQGGLALEHDELGRDAAHVDGGDRPRLEELLQGRRRVVEQVHLLALDGRLLGRLERGRRVGRRPPWPVELGSREPPIHQPQVVFVRRPIEEEQHPRVDHPQEAGARDLPQHRLAIDAHEQRGPLADDDPRRVVLDLDDAAGILHPFHLELGLKPIERHRQRLA